MSVQGANRLNIPDGVQGGTAYQYDMTWRVHDRDLRDAVQLSGVRRSLSTGDVFPLTGAITAADLDVLRWIPSEADVQDSATFEVQFTAVFEDGVARNAPSTWVVWEHTIINGDAPMPPPGAERFVIVNTAGCFVIISREEFLALIGTVPPDPDSLVLRDAGGGVQGFHMQPTAIEAGRVVTVPAGMQMLAWGTFSVEGELIVNGEFVNL
jgi:hypothetical protein